MATDRVFDDHLKETLEVGKRDTSHERRFGAFSDERVMASSSLSLSELRWIPAGISPRATHRGMALPRHSYHQHSGEDTKNKNVYVKGLKKTCSREDVQQMFAVFGGIEESRFYSLKGTALVQFRSRKTAERAIAEMHGRKSHPLIAVGQALRVRFAYRRKPSQRTAHCGATPSPTPTPRESASFGFGAVAAEAELDPATRFQGLFHGLSKLSKAQESDLKNIYVRGLRADLNEDGLRSLFGSYGRIANCKFCGGSKGVALIRFSQKEEAASAIAGLHGKAHSDDPRISKDVPFLIVKFANSRAQRRREAKAARGQLQRGQESYVSMSSLMSSPPHSLDVESPTPVMYSSALHYTHSLPPTPTHSSSYRRLPAADYHCSLYGNGSRDDSAAGGRMLPRMTAGPRSHPLTAKEFKLAALPRVTGEGIALPTHKLDVGSKLPSEKSKPALESDDTIAAQIGSHFGADCEFVALRPVDAGKEGFLGHGVFPLPRSARPVSNESFMSSSTVETMKAASVIEADEQLFGAGAPVIENMSDATIFGIDAMAVAGHLPHSATTDMFSDEDDEVFEDVLAEAKEDGVDVPIMTLKMTATKSGMTATLTPYTSEALRGKALQLPASGCYVMLEAGVVLPEPNSPSVCKYLNVLRFKHLPSAMDGAIARFDERDLQLLCCEFGKLLFTRLFADGRAFVGFVRKEDATLAIDELDNKCLPQHSAESTGLHVKLANSNTFHPLILRKAFGSDDFYVEDTAMFASAEKSERLSMASRRLSSLYCEGPPIADEYSYAFQRQESEAYESWVKKIYGTRHRALAVAGYVPERGQYQYQSVTPPTRGAVYYTHAGAVTAAAPVPVSYYPMGYYSHRPVYEAPKGEYFPHHLSHLGF